MLRSLPLLLTLLTGFSGLVYEVGWQRYLATLLGSHGEATAAVLGIFLGGLSAGYALFGRLSRRLVARAARRGERARLLLLYGLVEASIGLHALAFPVLFAGARELSYLAPGGHDALGFALDVLLTVLLIGPPTVLMGGTIPVLTQALPRDLGEASRVHAHVYGFNTAGAFLGALCAGFVLVPRLGLDGTVQTMGVINLFAGGVFLLLERGVRPESPLAEPVTSSEPGSATASGGIALAVVALLAGFAMMTVQVVLNRVGGLALGSSQFTFSMVVATFVLCIALGSFAVSALPRIPPLAIVGSQWALVATLALVYLGLPDTPYWAHMARTAFGSSEADFVRFHLLVFAAGLVALAVPIGLSGALLPLLFHHLRGKVADLGAVAGRLYAWNTVGSLLGALVGGYALLTWLDLHQVFRVALCALAVGSALLTLRVLRVRAAVALGLAGVAVLGTVALPGWAPEQLSAGFFRLRTPQPFTGRGPAWAFAYRNRGSAIVLHDDDPTVSVTVRRSAWHDGRVNLAIFTDGKSDSALLGDYATMSLAALLPALFAEDPSQCFVIGYGTGVTAGELGSLSDVARVRVAEISSGVLRAAPLFDRGNLGAALNPKVETVRTDAYRALRRSEQRYGVISSEPSNPWRLGVEMLYSREFLEAARERLAPGGVYAQWFHLYEMDLEVVRLVLRTYDAVFEHVAVWYTQGPDVLLLGFDDPARALDLARLRERFERSDYGRAFRRIRIEELPQLLAHEILPLGVLRAARLEGELHTLRHPLLSDHAARAFFRGGSAEVPRLPYPESARIGTRHSLLRRGMADGEERAEAELLETVARETCWRDQPLACATLVARHQLAHPGSSLAAEVLRGEAEDAPLRGVLEPELLAALRGLFGGGHDLPPTIPVDHLERLTRLYAEHYHHAFPFQRARLAAAWERCTASAADPEACARAREAAELRVGPLQEAPPERGPEPVPSG